MDNNHTFIAISGIPPYSLQREEKHEILTALLSELTRHHYEKCAPYRGILNAFSVDPSRIEDCSDIPFLPVRLFKEFELLSVERSEVVRTMTSSGTTGQAVSKIFLDKETAANQQKALVKIVSSFVGPKRLPLIILDTSEALKDRLLFSARGAGILGFSVFGRETVYALDENMRLDIPALSAFLARHQGETLLLFGFTFMIWQYFYKEIIRAGYQPDLSKGILFHGGGWKKLTSEAVSSREFKDKLQDTCGLKKTHDYYGMVEQTGSIYVECDHGNLHASGFSEVMVRRPMDFSPASFGEKGIIEVLSVLPGSYPGHALLTEDEGVILGEDNCPCGRSGKYFKVTGRLQNAEMRGCSDTYVVNRK